MSPEPRFAWNVDSTVAYEVVWDNPLIARFLKRLAEIRCGLHTDEIELDGSDVSGIAVAIGARVCALAEPSEVLVSQTVRDLVVGSGSAFEDRGEHELKGVPDRWHLYRVVT